MSAVKAYEGFIAENAAIAGAKCIGVYKDGKRVGHVPLGPLKRNMGQKLYSFGAVSDIHVDEANTTYPTSVADCQKAFQFYNSNEDIAFLCICGDLTVQGAQEELEFYKALVEEYIPDKPVYVAAGNHEEYGYHYAKNGSSHYEEVVGNELYYSFEHQGDVFIMCGVLSSHEDKFFSPPENDASYASWPQVDILGWLEEVLEANKNKRCFLFQHIPTKEGSGGSKHYEVKCLDAEPSSLRFKELLAKYQNAIHFHGHTHFKFELQEMDKLANYDSLFGGHSVHIPSLTVPRGLSDDGTLTGATGLSQGYVVDVYENGIHLRGRDFVNDLEMPIASYWLDTTVKTVE